MPNWNDGYIYNALGQDGGFFWNGADFILLLRLHDTLNAKDNLPSILAHLIMSEQFDTVYEELVQSALVKQVDEFTFDEDMFYLTVFKIAEQIGMKDEITDLIVLSFLHDDMRFIEELKILGTLLQTDDTINIKDITTVQSYISLLDKYGLKDNIDFVQFILSMRDSFGMTDGLPNPKLSVSDFIIGVTGRYDNAYDWLLPFDLKIDWNTSSLQIMPEAENTTLEMAGVDGSIWEDCVYKDRLFSIVGYSEQGLTVQEKEQLKTRITEILDYTKHESKKLTVQDRGVSFDVKYTGLADIQEGSSWIKATIPFMAQPYGYRSFEDEYKGSALIDNSQGDAPLGPVFEISGPVSNPSFEFYDQQYSYSGTIPRMCKLVIDFNMLSCYIIGANSQKTNAMAGFNGTFKKIEKGRTAILKVPTSLRNNFITRCQVRCLW